VNKELYFDISSEKSGGSLYRQLGPAGQISFYYDHSTYDEAKDDLKVFQSRFPRFEDFWQDLIKNKEWHYLHPLFVHPEQREFVAGELKKVDWSIYPDLKWQQSHQRQWKKVLEAPENYYRMH
jgi:hypothetical protein